MSAPLDELPLVNATLADELFSPQGTADDDAMQRDIWSGIAADLIPDLQSTAANACDADSLRTELHRIRGYCATCALVRLAACLHRWELLPNPAANSAADAAEAIALAQRSILEIEHIYPHLKLPAA